MHRLVVVTALGAAGVFSLAAQSILHLKARVSNSLLLEAISETPPQAKRFNPGRRYRIFQYTSQPALADIADLELRGARVLQYVPDHALLVEAPDDFEPGPRVSHVDALRTSDKWSPELNAAVLPLIAELTKTGDEPNRRRVLAEFYPGVPDVVGRQIAGIEGLSVVEHPDLQAGHLLVEGTDQQLRELAAWEEIAYLFPASADLAAGRPVHRCGGGMTGVGGVGQYVAKIGDGWDGAGRNAAQLRYLIDGASTKVPAEDAVREIERALAEWSKAVRIDFTRGGRNGDARLIEIRFAKGSHGDPYPFDGSGRVLAHTFYPAPPNAEPLAGDLHLDDDESWKIGNDIDLYSVVLHELGHALGLGHSDKAGSVMYAYYQRLSTLTDEDTNAARELYASREVAPPATPPATAPPPSDPAPAPPANPPAPATPPANPSAPSTPDRTAPTLAISSPASSSVATNAATYRIAGTAADNVGVAKVTCTSNVEGVINATGTVRWSVEVPLALGYNNLVLRAYDGAGNSSWRSVVITRK